MPHVALLVRLLQFATQDRTQLVLENIALRHQLAVYKRTVARPHIKDGDRIFWLTVMKMLREWRQALVFVQPDTVIRWHRNGFRHHWRRKSKGKPGGPPISMALIHLTLIVRMATENPSWGYARIQGELEGVGHKVARSTVAKVLKENGIAPSPDRPSSWRAFLKAHWGQVVAADFFTTEVWTRSGLRTIYTLFVIDLKSRKVHVAGHTRNPPRRILDGPRRQEPHRLLRRFPARQARLHLRQGREVQREVQGTP